MVCHFSYAVLHTIQTPGSQKSSQWLNLILIVGQRPSEYVGTHSTRFGRSWMDVPRVHHMSKLSNFYLQLRLRRTQNLLFDLSQIPLLLLSPNRGS
jgi:hypothetical protein